MKDKKVVYISGNTNGVNHNLDIFEAAEEKLKARGYSVVNPVHVLNNIPFDNIDHDSIVKINWLIIKNCDIIYMLKGWDESEDAKSELEYACGLRLEVMYEEDE